MAERDTHNPLTVEHTFRIASNTKTYVAAAILRLAESDRLSLDDSLGDGTTDCRLGIFCVDFGDHLAWGHTGFWNTFAFHVPTLDLTVSGCILDHFATKGQELAKLLVEAVAADSH